MMTLNIGKKILLAAAAIVVASFTILIIYFDIVQHKAISQSLKTSISETSNLASAGITNWMSGRKLMIEGLGQNFAKDTSSDNVRKFISNKSYSNNFMFTYFGSAEGVMTMEPNEALPDGYDPRKRPWYTDTEKAGASVLTEPYTDASTGQLIVTLTTPILDNGTLKGVVGGDLDIGILAELVRSVNLGGTGYAFLANEQGVVLIHPDKNLTLKSMEEAFGKGAPKVQNGIFDLEEGKSDKFFSFTLVQGLPSVKWYLGLAIDRDKAFSSLYKFRYTTIIMGAIAVLAIMILMGLLVHYWVSKPIMSMTGAMTRLAGGELDVEVPCRQHKDEIGSMASAVEVFKNNATEMIRLAQDNEKNAQRIERERTKARLQMADSFEASVSSIVGEVVAAAEATQKVASALSRSAEESNNRALAVSSAAEETTVSVQTVAASTEELSAAIAEIGQQVTLSINIANEAMTGVDQTGETVQQLSSAAERIGEVVGLIQNIAGQTNLLALNATIEAARAGEAGKGFAVVAGEVKNLANQTDKATGDIQKQVEDIQGSSSRSVNEIGSITTIIERINEYANAIAAAVEQQGAATQEIAESVQRAAAGTQEVSSNVNAVSESSKALNQEADSLLQSSKHMENLASRMKTEIHNFLTSLRTG